MQPHFNSAKGKCVIANCLVEIQKAVKNKAHIIFLEYSGYGATSSKLTKGLRNHAIFVEKDNDDGSNQIQKEVLRHKLPKYFKVCGINTDCCVAQTVKGLTARFPKSKIEVLADACASDWNHLGGLEEMKRLKGNVKVV